MSKLSFRARALDPCKPMPIFLAEELPDLPEYSAINRAVPQMPSGMEKEEESVSILFIVVSLFSVFRVKSGEGGRLQRDPVYSVICLIPPCTRPSSTSPDH